jgi:hypothetical protein
MAEARKRAAGAKAAGKKAAAPNRTAASAPPLPSARRVIRRLEDLEPLLPAEARIVAECESGNPIVLGSQRPSKPTPDNALRGELLRFLLVGKREDSGLSPSGLMIVGAFIVGDLDLVGCTAQAPLHLLECRLGGDLQLTDAELKGAFFISSSLNRVIADRLICGALSFNGSEARQRVSLVNAKIKGQFDCRGARFEGNPALAFDRTVFMSSVALSDGFKAYGEVRGLGCHIEGNLECSNGLFRNYGGTSLGLDRLSAKGNVNLHSKFRSRGIVRLGGARIDGELSCVGGSFGCRKGTSILANNCKVKGSVFLINGFVSMGEVRMNFAQIEGSLHCDGAAFRNRGGVSLDLEGSSISGTFFFSDLRSVLGTIDLTNLSAGAMSDQLASWPSHFVLDGFSYRRLVRTTTDAPRRIDWLKKQTPGRFFPQPWEHLARVLREMGHLEDARLLAIEQQRVMRKLRVIGNRKPVPRTGRVGRAFEISRVKTINGFTRFLHRLYGALAGYGYRPLRTVAWMGLIWAVAFGVNLWAADQGLFVPKAVQAEAANAAEQPYRRSSFSPAVFALDALLPLVDLKQEADWTPAVERSDGSTNWTGWAVRALMWVEILFGWLGSLLLVAAVGRLVQKD